MNFSEIFLKFRYNKGMKNPLKKNVLFFRSHQNILWDIAVCGALLLVVSGIGSLFYRLHLDGATIILLYLLGVMVVSILTTVRLTGVLFSIASVLIYNYLFTIPRFTFHAYGRDHLATFMIMLAASVLAGSLAVRLKNNAKAFRQDAYSAKVLFNTSQQLSKAKGPDQAYSCMARQLQDLFGCGVIVYPIQDDQIQETITAGTISQKMLEKEQMHEVQKVLKKGGYAGIVAGRQASYAPVHLEKEVLAVVGLEKVLENIDEFEENIFLSILGECAMTLENQRVIKERQEARIEAENERLRADLLRMISHDLRTPLTSIYGNATNLLHQEEQMDPAVKNQVYQDIYDDSRWLIELVENLLAITRLDQKQVDLHRSQDVVEDVIEEALKHVEGHTQGHKIVFERKDDFSLAYMDSRLIMQVVVNLINNAIKYTPSGSTITIQTESKDSVAYVTIMDDGPGIPDEQKEHVFEMFYTGTGKLTDTKRSLGLGLALCKSVIEAHHGELILEDNQPHGAKFTFSLPQSKEEAENENLGHRR